MSSPVISNGSSSGNSGDVGSGGYQTSPRGRAIKSCRECRRRKMRCSRSQPCQNCSRFSRACVYLPYPDWPQTGDMRVPRQTSRESQSPPNGIETRTSPFPHTPPVPSGNGGYNDPSSLHDSFYEVYDDDYNLDKGFQIGRMIVPEKIGSKLRPQLASKITGILAPNIKIDAVSTKPSQMAVPSYRQLDDPYATPTARYIQREVSLQPPTGLLVKTSQYPRKWENYFPSLEEGKVLYTQYLSAVDPLVHIIHKPSFELELHNCLFSPPHVAPVPSFKALLLAMYLAAALSLCPVECQIQLVIDKNKLVGKLEIATEKALADANYVGSHKVQTLQAFTMYMTAHCRHKITKAQAISVGVLYRLGRGAGLHRNANGSTISPEEAQMREFLWHQICSLELHTSEIRGRQPGNEDDDFDNLHAFDVDIVGGASEQHSRTTSWTETTISLLRYECNMVHRFIYRQRVAIDKKTADLTTVQRLVDQRKKEIETKYLESLDERSPIQRCAKMTGKILIARFDWMLLSRYLDEDLHTEHQRQIEHNLLKSSLTICECAAVLETDPDLHSWSWYSGSYQQYGTAGFLLMELLRYPDMPYADRINTTLDHVFGRAPDVGTTERNRDVLRLLMAELDRMHHFEKAQTITYKQESPPSLQADEMTSMFDLGGERQWMGDWQPDMTFNQDYLNTPVHTPEGVDYSCHYPPPQTIPGYFLYASTCGEGYEMPSNMYPQ